MEKNNVIFLEKTPGLCTLWRQQLAGMAPQLIKHFPDSVKELDVFVRALRVDTIALVVIGNEHMDGKLGTDTITHLRSLGYTGPMLVCSSNPHAQIEQVNAGGTNTFPVGAKKDVVQTIVDTLGI